MKPKFIASIILVFFLTIFFFVPTHTMSQGPENFPPDKELSARMLRFGMEAYARGKYLDAKEYFRKAVKADPTSLKAWRYYDQTVIFGLAEKVEKDANLILPDVSTRQEGGISISPTPPTSPPPPEPAVRKKEETGFKIVDDEGC
ncbi:MAG: tetratricopeptide repeat protein [Desulfobacterales bacterium]|nr:tetratricopeptide repeat protein [Desulfobacterales bacterium]